MTSEKVILLFFKEVHISFFTLNANRCLYNITIPRFLLCYL